MFGVAVLKMAWQWVTGTLWPWCAGHPWWTALIVSPVAVVLLLAVGLLLDMGDYEVGESDVLDDESSPCALTFSLGQLATVSPTGFEHACRELLIRDGFTSVRCIGGAGDLGVDVIAWDQAGRKIVMQCKQYARPVGSREVQTFNGTARPEHRGDVVTMVGLNGFTAPAADFSARHDITLVDRSALERWAAGEHLYHVIPNGVELT